MIPKVPKSALWVGGAVCALVLIWMLAKTILPFAVGVFCGASTVYILLKGSKK